MEETKAEEEKEEEEEEEKKTGMSLQVIGMSLRVSVDVEKSTAKIERSAAKIDCKGPLFSTKTANIIAGKDDCDRQGDETRAISSCLCAIRGG